MRPPFISLLLIATLAAFPAFADFKAGAAKVDITPEPGFTSWGYSPPPTMTGTLDPLYAKAIVVEANNYSVAIVSFDLGRVLLPNLLGGIRESARKLGIDHVMFTASHTHSAPPADVDADYTREMARKTSACIAEAHAALQDASIGVGRTTIDIASNRRKILENGQCMMVWRNEAQVPGIGPVDHEAGIIRIDSADGEPIAVLTNYACHPVILSWDNTEYSADYVGELNRVVEDSTGAVSLFLQGGSGDINPYLDKTPIDEGGVEAMRSVGRTAGNAVIAALQGIQTAVPESPSVKVSQKRVEVGVRWDLTKQENRDTLKKVYGRLFDKYLADLPADLSVPVSVILINDTLAFANVPGELFVQYQLDLKKLSPVKDTFMVGYADEFHIYFPTIKDSAARGYGAATNTYVGVGAGDRMLTELLLDIGRLSGKILPDPTVEDFEIISGGPHDTLETISD